LAGEVHPVVEPRAHRVTEPQAQVPAMAVDRLVELEAQTPAVRAKSPVEWASHNCRRSGPPVADQCCNLGISQIHLPFLEQATCGQTSY